ASGVRVATAAAATIAWKSRSIPLPRGCVIRRTSPWGHSGCARAPGRVYVRRLLGQGSSVVAGRAAARPVVLEQTHVLGSRAGHGWRRVLRGASATREPAEQFEAGGQRPCPRPGGYESGWSEPQPALRCDRLGVGVAQQPVRTIASSDTGLFHPSHG